MLTFESLKSEYDNLWATMKVRPDRAAAVDAIACRLMLNYARYQAAERTTGVPWFVIAAWHNRESDADFSTQLAQGDPLDRRSVNVPSGRGPFDTWEEGAKDALVTLKHLDQIKEWTPARICYETERYNGFGYRNRNVKSPYLWSFTNHYTSGKYVADGDFKSYAVDKQCGAIPVMKSLMAMGGVKDTDTGSVGKPPPPAQPSTGWLTSMWAAFLAWVRHKTVFADNDPDPVLPADKPTDLAGRIVAAMRKRGFKVDDVPGNPNVVYVEGMGPDGAKNDNTPNQFNDARFVIMFGQDGRPKIAGAWEATTEPGRYWTQNPMNSGGAARIKFGQYTAWQVGMHHTHEALVQTGGNVTVCRDLNEDYKRDGDKEDTGQFGINQHWGYDFPKNDLGQSSAGCLVGRMKTGHQQFMALMKSDPRYKANSRFVFTAAVLPASEV
jgi:lysozyme family protein